ncbi:nucleotide-binding alpha-beta plait domain-containing protein [Tanacetum coccineum]
MYKTSTSNQHEDGILEQVKRRHRGNEFRPHNVDINGHVNSTKVDTGSSDFERVMRKKATSFFFTNFLDSWDSKALWKMVGRYRIVVDVYVAFKKTKLNTRFGFVRPSKFIETVVHHRPSPNSTKVIKLEENASLKARLVNCWIGKAKKFEVVQNAWDIIKGNGLDECNTKYLGGLSFLFEWSSKEMALKSLKSNNLWLQQWFDDLKPWDDRCLSTAKKFEVVQNAWDIIKGNGLDECNTKYLGGLSFLFEWSSKEMALKSLKSNNLWLQQWFDDLKPWDDRCLSTGRLVWINFEGIPMVARNHKSIFTLASSFGDVLEAFNHSVKKLTNGNVILDSLLIKTNLLLRILLVVVGLEKEEPLMAHSPKIGSENMNLNSGADLYDEDINISSPIKSCDSNVGPVIDATPIEFYDPNELLSSFQKISEEVDVNTKIKGYKRKNKGKKKRLVVGGNNCYSLIHSSNSIDDLNEANTMMNINKKRLVK